MSLVDGTKLLNVINVNDQDRTVTVTMALVIQWWDPFAHYFYDEWDIQQLWYVAPDGPSSITAAQATKPTQIIDDDFRFISKKPPFSLEYRVTRTDTVSNADKWAILWFPWDTRTVKLEYSLPAHAPGKIAYVFGDATLTGAYKNQYDCECEHERRHTNLYTNLYTYIS